VIVVVTPETFGQLQWALKNEYSTQNNTGQLMPPIMLRIEITYLCFLWLSVQRRKVAAVK